MEKKITKRETMKLLKMAQKFQREYAYLADGIDITTQIDENGRLWFILCVTISYGVYEHGHCYEWRSYEKNLASLERVMSFLKKEED